MKIALTLFGYFISLSLGAQSFYDQGTIQSINVSFSQSNWDALMDVQKQGAGNYIMAQSVSINGVVFDSVGVKYKGNSTYNANQVKNPWHIELDTYKSQNYQGFKDIKLSNVSKDPSFLREVLSYDVARKYMDASQSNYANLYVNGNLIGLYTSSEAITKSFVKEKLYSKNNTFIKCNPPAGAGPNTVDLPGLEYLGQDSTDYYDAYELKSAYGWQQLINLSDTLKNTTTSIEDILDIDRALWMLAFDNVLVNLDSYLGGFKQNYYLYRMDNNRFAPIVWDLNESFGKFSMTGTSNLNSTTSKQQMSHLLHSTDAAWPLISKLLAIPTYKKMYLAHVKTIVNENFSNGAYMLKAQSLYNTIDSAVQNDPNKLSTYAQFQSNITTDVNSGGPGPMGGSAPGIQNLMNTRATYLMSRSDFTAVEPSITNVSTSNATPSLGSQVYITAEVSDEDDVYLGIRDSVQAMFSRVPMFDDGMHGDGSVNDGVYGAEVSMTTALKQYYIYAENATIGKFSPVRAEHEYHLLSVGIAPGDLVINEFMASNDGVIADANGDFVDWIELYNASNTIIDLGEYSLSDDLGVPNKYEFPTENLNAGDFKLVWASGDTTKGNDHANFKLSKSGEEVALFKKNGNTHDTIDFMVYLTQTTDVSYGRETDASPNWVSFLTSTPDASNGTLSLEETPAKMTFSLYPNPFAESFLLSNEYNKSIDFTIYNLAGKLISSGSLGPLERRTIKDNGPSGLRVMFLSDGINTSVQRIIKR